MNIIFLPLLGRWNLRLFSLYLFNFYSCPFSTSIWVDQYTKVIWVNYLEVVFVFCFWWSVCMVSGRDNSCMSACLFFMLQFCKSGSLKTYMYMCIKYTYIKIMLFKYLHIKPKDWLSSQNYWNYLPQEHLDLRNLYSNTFFTETKQLVKWVTSSAPFVVHIGSLA